MDAQGRATLAGSNTGSGIAMSPAHESIVQYFADHCDSWKVPRLTQTEWLAFKGCYSKDEIRRGLADYIHRFQVPFPIIRYTEQEVRDTFLDLTLHSALSVYRFPDPTTVLERHPYRARYAMNPLGVIGGKHQHNLISNYYQQVNRLGCASNHNRSALDVWSDAKRLETQNWIFWRPTMMASLGLNAEAFRQSFRLGSYTAGQFRPLVAKALYERHRATRVLDTSCGWGDRLAGFYATPSTTLYVGCDPNPAVFETYKAQCVAYEKFLGCAAVLTESPDYFECRGTKTVQIWRKPSEDVEWDRYPKVFDFYFTSPPYFSTERYGKGKEKELDQSWSRYTTFDLWKEQFFFPVTRSVWPTLQPGAFMLINIIEPSKSKDTNGSIRHLLCDDMVEEFSSFPDAYYVGKIGMEQPARPNTVEAGLLNVEPIWTFRKGSAEYPYGPPPSLDRFF